MALTAWEKALRDGYIAQHVYRLMFLVAGESCIPGEAPHR